LKTLVTVDWDFFVPENPNWDMGHEENLLFLNFMWKTRAGLFDMIKTTGLEKGFWERTGLKAKAGDYTYVSDSHLFAYGLLKGIDNVVLVDAHHDCWKEGGKNVYCHNWLRLWLEKNKKNRATWVCPEWAAGNFTLPADMDRVTVVHEMPDVSKMNVRDVHICRSGCWTAPWLDKQFIEFVEDRGGWEVPLQVDAWNPLKERWSQKDFQEMRDQQQKVDEALKGMKTGSIGSSFFIDGFVELSQKVGANG
jgi:hypothetical protein